MKVLIFGTGEYYERFKKWVSGEEVVALLDNSAAKQNTFIDGIEVLSPKAGIKKDYDVIIIMSFYIKAMKAQLLELGVAAEKIYHFYDLRKLINLEENRQFVKYYGITEQALRESASKIIGLLSTDMTLGGTAIALFHMAEILKKQGYSIVFASMLDGPLREELVGQGIPVVVDPNLQLATMRETEWLLDFRFIICNAINYYIFLSERDLRIPIIWWLHDSAFFYDGVDREVLRQIPQENLTVFSVGSVPKEAVHRIWPELLVDQLLYGVKDTGGGRKRVVHRKKMCFVTIGCIEERKGQDILLQAVWQLPEELRKRAVFYLVGNDASLFAARIREEARQMPEINLVGAVGRATIHKILEDADVMVCPSREDPMPTVAAEAMSHCVPCILSDVIGMAAYIQDGQNGLVFQNGNAVGLCEKIGWCIKNRTILAEMGEKARKIYEAFFSMERFGEEMDKAIRRSIE